MTLSPYALFVLPIYGLAWSCWGIVAALEIYPYARTLKERVFTVAISGPAVWGVTLWRGILAARHAILRRHGVDKCTCHHH